MPFMSTARIRPKVMPWRPASACPPSTSNNVNVVSNKAVLRVLIYFLASHFLALRFQSKFAIPSVDGCFTCVNAVSLRPSLLLRNAGSRRHRGLLIGGGFRCRALKLHLPLSRICINTDQVAWNDFALQDLERQR